MSLLQARSGTTYTVRDINTRDEEMGEFLFRLGCYSGEAITLISRRRSGCIVAIKDGRYSLDRMLSEAIMIDEYRENQNENRFCRKPE